VRFQDAAPDARAIVYAGIQADPIVADAAALVADASPPQRVLVRAVMNGGTTDPDAWRVMFPTLLGPAADPALRERSERTLAAALVVANRGEAARSQYRGALVESVAERLLARRAGPSVRRERRILFDGVRAEIHPYDVTVEGSLPEAYDCKWGARGINAEVLLQLGAARDNAAAEGVDLAAALVVFDAHRSCLVRLARVRPPAGIGLVALETLRTLARGRPAPPGRPAPSRPPPGG
jgi:hypothetical protein